VPASRFDKARNAVEDSYALSPVQEAMFFHAVAAAVDDLYVIQQRVAIEGPLDVARFQQAWSRIVDRHPALRTAFVWEEPAPPVQLVCQGVDVAVELVDVSGETDPVGVIDARCVDDRRRRFALDAPPLMRILVFRLADDRHEMVWSQHHLLEDGWSATTVLREVFDTYEALAEHREPELPPVRPFGDYVRWLGSLDPAAAEGFWRRQLAGFSEPTRLAAVGAAAEEWRYVRSSVSLGAPLSAGLRNLARRHRLTLNTVLSGAMAIVLSRYVGKADVALGVVSSGRPYSLTGVESMVGMFINTLVLRTTVDAGRPVVEWLAGVQTQQSEMLEHQYTPLTSVQRWTELGGGVTPTDTLFAFWGFGGSDTSTGRTLRYRTIAGYGRNSFPVSVTVEAADDIRVELDFDTGDFDEATGARLLAHYATLVEAMVAAPETPIMALRMLTATEEATLAAVNDTATALPHDTVLAAFRSQVARTPEAAAVVCGPATITYRELDERSDALAAVIAAQPHDGTLRVAVYLPRSIELMVAVWGALKAGAAYVPIDRHHPRERVALLIADSGAQVVVTNTELAVGLPSTTIEVVTLPLEQASPAEPDAVPDSVIPSDAAYVMYTSGSTGRPKGVVVTHGNLMNYVAWAGTQYGGDGAVSLPLYTSVGFDLTVTSMYLPLLCGGSVVVYPDAAAADLSVIDVFAEDRVDVVKLTPSHLAVLEPHDLATTRIRTLIVGGEELTTTLASRTVEASGGRITIFNEYGPTEATVGCMIHRFDPSENTAVSVPIGRPAANTQVHVLDACLTPVPPGAVGELYVAGAGVTCGYLDQPALTDAVYVANPFAPGTRMYRTGDHARRLPSGVVEYLGRSDDQVKVRGFRIELGEIETVLATHASIVAAAVAVREPHVGDQRMVGYYEATATTTPTVSELRNFLRSRLPEHMVPQHLVRLDALPLTGNGKLDRAALPDTLGGVTRGDAPIGPRTAAERLVAALSGELLGVEEVSMGDNFFDLGGHSVLAMQLIARIHTATGERLSPRVVLLNTLGQVAAALGSAPAASDVSAPAPGEGSHRVGTSAFFFGPSATPLFGIHTGPARWEAGAPAVLLCPPIGWEYMRTHWALRNVARLLVRQGRHVLRFDYFGTGDSSGESGDATVSRWVEDVVAAATELTEISGAGPLTAVGIRHGATLAALACRSGLALDRLVLWDPVVSGAAYLATLETMHREMLVTRRGGPPRGDVLGDELLGFPYPPPLRRELAAIDLAASPWPEVAATLLATQDRPEYRALAAAGGEAMRLEVVPDVGAWDHVASSYSTLLPVAVPGRIVSLLGGEQ